MSKFTSQAKIIILALFLAIGISYVSAAGTWTGPTVTAPGGNVDTPVNVGNNAQSKTGDLAVGAFLANLNSKFLGKVTIQDGTEGAGKVLMSNATGEASWVDSTSGGPSMTCNSIDTGLSFVGTKQVSLILGGKNMCTDNKGCSYSIMRYNAQYPEGLDFYGNTSYQLRQVPASEGTSTAGRWLDSAGNTRGVNGDNIAKAFLSWDGVIMYDDSTQPGGETSADAFSFEDTQNDVGYRISMCDL